MQRCLEACRCGVFPQPRRLRQHLCKFSCTCVVAKKTQLRVSLTKHGTSQSDIITTWLSFHMFPSVLPADGGIKGRSWKWREMLRFPHITHCVDLAMNIRRCQPVCVCETWAVPVTSRHLSSCVSPSGRDYYSLCVNQPIGKELFELFCRSRPDLRNYTALLKDLVHFKCEFTEFLL